MDVKETLSRLEKLADQFLQPADKQKLKRACLNIQQKHDSHKLYLAVVGEFSSGKSTFINALIGHRLLKEGVFPTTACATYLKHEGKELAVHVKFSDGKKYLATNGMLSKVNLYLQHKYHKEATDINQLIDYITSETSIAQDVTSLHISIPDAKFPPNIILIDTPGFNPGTLEANNHFEITSDVVEHIADMAIILTSAQQAMSSSLQHFLLNHVKRCLHRCIFVVSKIDMMPVVERTVVMDYTLNEITNRLGVRSPYLYGVSSITMLPAKKIPDIIADQWDSLKKNFEKFENSSWKLLEQKGKLVVSEHVWTLINTLINNIKQNITKVDAKLTHDEKLLSETRIESIREVTDFMVHQANQHFTKAVLPIRKNIANSLKQCEIKALEDVRQTILNCFIECKRVYNDNFERRASHSVNYLVNTLLINWSQTHAAQVDSDMLMLVSKEKTSMNQTFKSYYNRFSSLNGKIEKFPFDLSMISYSERPITGLDVANHGLQKQGNYYIKGRTAGDFKVEFSFLDPLVDVLESSIGFVKGFLFTNASSKKLRNYQIQSEQTLRNFFAHKKQEALENFDNVCLENKKSITEYGKLHVSTYGNKVSELITSHEQQILSLKERRKELHTAIDRLLKWQVEIEEKLVMLKQQ